MRRLCVVFLALTGGAVFFGAGTSACSGSTNGFGGPGGGNGPDGSTGPGNGDAANYGDVPSIGVFDGSTTPPNGDGGVACPAGLQCNVSCSGGGTTSISGKVYDPAGKNPLYNVAVYVPAVPLVALPKGVPTGADACSCEALYQSGAVVNTATAVDGSFKLDNVPVGNVPLVLQIGKWRKLVNITTKSCQDNPQADGSLALPGTIAAGDINDNMPDIAVSTGGADQLECLLRRIGVAASEYVPGFTQSGHVHIFNGGPTNGGFGGGSQEKQLMSGAPNSYASGALWDTTDDLMKNDIVLLSCEGGETYQASPTNLEAYLNAGGRAFASHFHYAWFNTAPPDWGTNLADWQTGSNGGNGTIGGNIVTTLTAGGTFPKGVALQQWLTGIGALGGTVGGQAVPAGELGIVQSRFNANVTNQAPSQSWIQADSNAGAGGYPTLYFSFDTPVGAAKPADGGSPNYCGRAVFSGLHVGGASYDSVNCPTNGGIGGGGEGCPTGHVAVAPPPAGCDTTHDLSPQEDALEFMLFDLSSCVLPDNVAPPDGGVVIVR